MTTTGHLTGIEILEAWDAHRRRAAFLRATRRQYAEHVARVAAVRRFARKVIDHG